MIESAQEPDGYLNIYFTVVDKPGRLKNFRDMHEMYNAGHMLEAALAHYHCTWSRQYLNVMIRNVDFWLAHVGPEEGKLHAYPGHPELELAVLRLYAVTQEPRHLEFARYLLTERGVTRPGDTDTFFNIEAKTRGQTVQDGTYHQAHEPIVKQDNMLGHSVRAFYLLTAAADAGGELLTAARRLWTQAVRGKMYVTGGFGSEPGIEGFHKHTHRLPQSTAEGGCYTETCASIACMMVAERLLADELDGTVRDTLELAFLNGTLGGASLDGKAFSYANKLATCGDETAFRKEWFEVCCCPPSLSRTMGLLGGYTWTVAVDEAKKVISLDVLLLLSATRTIPLPDGTTATATMTSGMPWRGHTELALAAPKGWTWDLHLPAPSYATDIKTSVASKPTGNGFLVASALPASTSLTLDFCLPVRILADHPAAGGRVTVTRGPIVYVAESVDNAPLDAEFPHFEGLGIAPGATFTEAEEVTFVLWFARANRGGAGRLRTSFMRAE